MYGPEKYFVCLEDMVSRLCDRSLVYARVMLTVYTCACYMYVLSILKRSLCIMIIIDGYVQIGRCLQLGGVHYWEVSANEMYLIREVLL